MTLDPKRIHNEERIVGKRAPYHVYYQTRTGAYQYSPAYPDELTVEAATAWMHSLFAELRIQGYTILHVVRTTPVDLH